MKKVITMLRILRVTVKMTLRKTGQKIKVKS
jgi:hypothetical protein